MYVWVVMEVYSDYECDVFCVCENRDKAHEIAAQLEQVAGDADGDRSGWVVTKSLLLK